MLFFRKTLFFNIMKMTSKSRLTLIISLYERTDCVFLRNLPLGLRPEIILSRCPSTAQRMHRNLKSQWEKKENWFGCLMPQILFFLAYMQTALKINLSENYPSYFHNFQKPLNSCAYLISKRNVLIKGEKKNHRLF